MTRWVRSGSSQKHKKMPGDATKWGEFDHQKRSQNSPKKTKVKREEISCTKINNSRTFDNQGVSNINPTENNAESLVKPETNILNTIKESEEKKAHETNTKGAQIDDKNLETSSPVKKKNKEKYLKQLQKKRADNGILLLPPNVERKLYNIKRKLRSKGAPPDVVKEVIRKERRKAELCFRKTFNPSKLCFHCRKPGHVLAECPKKLGTSTQETGMCFKCGSPEHTSFKCPKKVQGFPFAKCFICKEQGHISKDCSKNKHGVYPKGGRCNICGNVNHLKKDCPSLLKQNIDETPITLHTLKEKDSVDEEVMKKSEVKRKTFKKPKIVKF